MKLLFTLFCGALYLCYASGVFLLSALVCLVCFFAWLGFRTGHNDRPWRKD